MNPDALMLLATLTGLISVVPMALALACGVRVPGGWLRAAAGLGLVSLVGRMAVGLIFAGGRLGWDIKIFWDMGHAILTGIDPYAPEVFGDFPAMNPPSTHPIFMLMASGPYRLVNPVWIALNTILAVLLVPAGVWAIRAQEASDGLETPRAWSLGPDEVGLVTAAVAVSNASIVGLDAGQFCILSAVALFVALGAAARRASVAAGIALAVATAKVGTLIPFLLLFWRRRDVKVWVALGAAVLALCAIAGELTDLPRRCRLLVGYLGEHSSPGMLNDLGYTGPNNDSIIGLDHALYRLGLRAKRPLAAVTGILLLVLTALIGSEVAIRRRIARGAACSLVAVFSAIFLYHRLYDLVVCALPLVYAVGRVREGTVRARPWFAASAVALIVAINLPRKVFILILERSAGWGAIGPIARALILPMATYAVLVALFALWRGARLDARDLDPIRAS